MKQLKFTKQMERFRRKARTLWDIIIADCSSDIELTEPFFEVRRLLFCGMILSDWREAAVRANDPLINSTIGLREGEIRVVSGRSGTLPVWLNQIPGARSNAWASDLTHIDTEADTVYLIDFFDWDEQYGMDHELYLVKVTSAERKEQLSECYGLVSPRHCQFILDLPPKSYGVL